MFMHHCVAYACVLIVGTLFGDGCVSVFFAAGSAPEEYRDYPNEESYPCIEPSGKQTPFVHSDTILLSRSCSLLLH